MKKSTLQTVPTIRFVCIKKRSEGSWLGGSIYETHIRMPDGKTFRWTKQIHTHTGWPQEQAARPTTYYNIPEYGSVRYPDEALNYLLERMERYPEEFERMYQRR